MFVRGAFYLYGGSFSEKRKFSRKQDFLVIFGLRAEKNVSFDDCFSALLSKLFSESVELFCDSFSTNNIVSLFRDLSKILLDFWREIFGNFVKTAFYITEDQLEEKAICRKNIVFHILWHLEGNLFWLRTTLVLRCWHDCVFFFFRAQFWYFVPTILNFLIKFDIWEWISSKFSSKILAQLSKSNSRVQTKFHEKLVVRWKV